MINGDPVKTFEIDRTRNEDSSIIFTVIANKIQN